MANADMTGKRHTLNMRTTKVLREKVEQAAAKSGRSLAQETEFRLERSFSTDDLLATLNARPELFWLNSLLGSAVDLIEEKTGKRWTEDPATYREVVNAFVTIMENYILAGDLPAAPDSVGRTIGRMAVAHLLEKWSKK